MLTLWHRKGLSAAMIRNIVPITGTKCASVKNLFTTLSPFYQSNKNDKISQFQNRE